MKPRIKQRRVISRRNFDIADVLVNIDPLI
jgi:hypothetical protein